MKKFHVILLMVAFVGLVGVATQWAMVAPAVADPQVGVAASEVALVLPTLGDDAKFLGSKDCKKCHIKEFKSWEDTAHAKAFETLKPNQHAEAKSAANLDPSKDYTQDAKCVACHTVGFGKPGGFEMFAADNADKAKEMENLMGVGCESCHGAGGAYIGFHEELKKSKAEYTDAEMMAKGLVKPDANTCTECHNDKSPTFKGFNYEESKAKGVHEAFPLKQRKE